MTLRFKLPGGSTILVGLVLGGCLPAAGSGSGTTESGLTTTNGLTMINGLTMTNGLSGSGLESGSDFMNTDTGRTTIAYLVRCALATGRSITKQDQNGVSYTFPGQIGVAPEWENGACGVDCQQQITACMLAHVNTTGAHIPLWLDGDSTAIGWDLDPDYPYEEGSFFGNIFVNPPVAYYCNGKDFDVGVVPGRLGAGLGDAPYSDPFQAPGYCRDHCTPADIPYQDDGYKACIGFNHVVTVWRNPDPSTITTTTTTTTSSAAGTSFSAAGSTRHRR